MSERRFAAAVGVVRGAPVRGLLGRFDRMPSVRWYDAAAVVAVVLAVAVAVRTVIFGGNAGCAFSDGRSYCLTARGDAGFQPFSRRPLVPVLVRLFHPGGTTLGFRLWAVVGLVLLAVTVAVLTARLTSTVSDPRLARPLALVAASTVVIMPHGIRLAWVYPVFTDLEAMALGALWVLLLTGRRPYLAPALALGVVLCREQWVVAVLVVAGCLLWRRRFLLCAAHVGAGVLAAVIDVVFPHSGASHTTPLSTTFSYYLRPHIWWALIACALIFACYATSRSLRSRVPDLELLLVVVGGLQVVFALLGGSDTPRLLAGAIPFLLPLALAWASNARGGAVRLLAISVFLAEYWRVWRLPSQTGYGYFFLPYNNPAAHTRIVAEIVCGVAFLLVLAATRRGHDSAPAPSRLPALD